MAHDWILDVLHDLCSYARANGLPGIAFKAEETLHVARQEIGASRPDEAGEAGDPAAVKRRLARAASLHGEKLAEGERERPPLGGTRRRRPH